MTRRRLLTLLAILALVAIPLAAGAGLCCAQPQTTCCAQHCAEPGVCSGLPAAQPEQVQAPTAVQAPAPLVTLAFEVLVQGAPKAPPPEQPRPRTPLLEGGACLHTTVLPPPVHA